MSGVVFHIASWWSPQIKVYLVFKLTACNLGLARSLFYSHWSRLNNRLVRSVKVLKAWNWQARLNSCMHGDRSLLLSVKWLLFSPGFLYAKAVVLGLSGDSDRKLKPGWHVRACAHAMNHI